MSDDTDCMNGTMVSHGEYARLRAGIDGRRG
jgi:hypothetical protein